jgi:NDP-sugar pyrophosphorylase family protein
MDAQGRITRFVEKPRPEEVFTDLANAGVLVVEPAVLEHIPPGEFFDFGLHLFPRLLEAGVSIYGWVIPRSAYLLDIGTPEKYEQARREWPVRERSLAWA